MPAISGKLWSGQSPVEICRLVNDHGDIILIYLLSTVHMDPNEAGFPGQSLQVRRGGVDEEELHCRHRSVQWHGKRKQAVANADPELHRSVQRRSLVCWS